MEQGIIWAIIGLTGIPSAITGICFWRIQHKMHKRDLKEDAREKARCKQEMLVINGIGAAIALGEATATALKNGRCNGETEKALKYARYQKHAQKEFLTEQGVKNIYEEA